MKYKLWKDKNYTQFLTYATVGALNLGLGIGVFIGKPLLPFLLNLIIGLIHIPIVLNLRKKWLEGIK